MNIQRAIRVLENEQKDHHSYSTDRIGKAEQLGIEALKRIQRQRIDLLPMEILLLRGETED